MAQETNHFHDGHGGRVTRRILDILQEDARTSQADIGRRVGLTASSVNARIKRLEREGYVKRYVALLDPERVGSGLTAFVEVDIEHPRHEKGFLELIRQLDEVQECHHITGQYSFLVKIKTRSIETLKDIILGKISVLPGIRGTRSLIALATVKESTRLSLADKESQR